MLKTLKNAWAIVELRKKILFTLFIILIYRLGNAVPVPYVDADLLADYFTSVNNTILGLWNTMSGGSFSMATIFALSIQPYINASIIIQLLTIAIPALERLSKEGGEEGRKKLASITRYTTVGIGLVMGFGYYTLISNGINGQSMITESGVWPAIVIIMTFMAGSALIMWMGEQINQKGVGNGISIILFAGIVARLPVTVGQVWSYFSAAMQSPESYSQYFIFAPLFVILFLAVIWVIVFMNDSERRIPVQYAKKVVGRKVYGGQSTFLPIKVTMSGVMPVIFASAILSIPSTIRMFITNPSGFWEGFFNAFSTSGWLYSVLYLLLIIMFAYFYMTIQYNPIEMANNLRANNGTIPGIRPGRPTAEFISKILSKVTLIGAIFLAVVAILPIIYGNLTGMHGLTMGGTSVIIMVGVALETVKQIESQMMMRHYKGFLD